MAEAVVCFLLDQLSSLFQQEYAHLEGFRRELQYIKDELRSMRAFLREAEAEEDRQDPDCELQEWVNQVREAAYDTEDVLDEFALRFGRHRASGFYGRFQKIYTSIKMVSVRHRISTQIKDIKYRVESISARHRRYKFESSTADGEEAKYDIRRHALLLEESDLVGIEKPKHELISHILDDQCHLKVVSVVGMGGMGKTTLVKRVYEDRQVKRNFSTHAWVTVSQRLQIKELFKNLLQQFYVEIQEQVPLEVEYMDGPGLRSFAKEFLKGKRFIIVLDDVWGIDSWDAIKYALPHGNCGSRVVLTTRIGDVASTSSKESCGHVYKMKPLSFEESWNLFCRKTFEDNCCPPHLEQISRGILSKCDGLPLAIVAVGGLLALKDRSEPEEWQRVRSSLVSELEGIGKLDRLKKILLLSYNDLPYFLKVCLLYISIYPEDYAIWVRRLISLWVAEGFVQERKGMTSKEVAEGYLTELINRSLLQVVDANADGTPYACNIHDLLREIVLSKSKDHNITTVVVGRYTKRIDNARRLAIHDFVDIAQGFQSKHLRSLVVIGQTNPFSSSSLSQLLRCGMKLLKVLDLDGTGLKDIPKEVFNMFHLRHLSLIGNPVEVIPKSIGKLRNLEFLNLFDTKVTELPVDIVKLGKLRELYAYQKGGYSEKYASHGFEAPYEIGQLVSLECLYHIAADNDKVVKEIGKLTRLRELGITKLRSKDGKELCSTLKQLTNLRRLSIASVKEDEILDLQHNVSPTPHFLRFLELRGPLEKLPRWLPSLQGLTMLILVGSRLMGDPLEYLLELPNLLWLVLNDAYEGGTLRFRAGGFQKLERLALMRLKRLRWIMAEEGTVPSLKRLLIADCVSLEELPQGIQNRGQVQTLRFNDLSDELITRVRKLFGIGNCSDGKRENFCL